MTGTNRMIPIPAGAIFTVTSGEYSDFSVRGVFRALKEIDADALVDAYLFEHPDNRGHYRFEEATFLA